jgi:hypothetical protein
MLKTEGDSVPTAGPRWWSRRFLRSLRLPDRFLQPDMLLIRPIRHSRLSLESHGISKPWEPCGVSTGRIA